MLLGDALHPGGLELTGYLGRIVGLNARDQVVDIACGRGTSAVYLAKHFSCHVKGLDLGPDNIAAAKNHASAEGVSHLTTFREANAAWLPFDDGAFDVVISECSLCTFPAKTMAAQDMGRILHISGRLGMTDVTVSDPLPRVYILFR